MPAGSSLPRPGPTDVQSPRANKPSSTARPGEQVQVSHADESILNWILLFATVLHVWPAVRPKDLDDSDPPIFGPVQDVPIPARSNSRSVFKQELIESVGAIAEAIDLDV